jgi:putative N6-adenine-specific DNA methylase
MFDMFATTALGLEKVLDGELGSLDIGTGENRRRSVEKAGVRFRGDFDDLMRANLHLRTANRVVLVLGEFPCSSPEDLYMGVREIAWKPFFPEGVTLAVSASVRNSALTHSLYAALTVKDAVCDQLREQTGARPNVDRDRPDIRIVARLIGERAIIGIDTSGESLHQRGYRVSSTEAPLKETLAAGLVLITGWNGHDPFLDPMCGSGTIPIEAALIARAIPPNLNRKRFGFMKLPWYDQEKWEHIREEARSRIRNTPLLIEASDIDARMIETARANAAAAGVESSIRFISREIRSLPKAKPFTVAVVNPPYGVRLGEVKALRTLYRAMGEMFRKRFSGSTVWVFTGNTGLAKYIPLKPSEKHTLFNGALRCRYLRFDIE